MALFKLRRKIDEPVAAAAPAESIEAMRRRARHRLIGAAVLVLLAVVGFPVLFDTQPRPIAVDIPIEIPDRAKVKPLTSPAPQSAPAKAAGAVSEAPVVVAEPVAKPAAVVASAAPASAAPPAAAIKAALAAPLAPSAPTAPTAPSTPPADDGARARALLEGKSATAQTAQAAASTQADSRYVVQVGAFADDSKARDVRQKVERAGLKTYVHVADTKEGKRTRVRVGPFTSRAEADKAADKLKALDLPAAILTL